MIKKLDKKGWIKQRIVWFFRFKRWRKSKWKDLNIKTSLRVKSNEEVFEIIQIYEILSESDCSEIEVNKAEFVTIFK